MKRYIATTVAQARERLNTFGFCVIEDVLPASVQSGLRQRFDPLFSGHFETGVFPDEWHWRKGISKESATREIVNAWKSDNTIASIVLHPQLARVVGQVMQWPGVRMAQDDVILKPSGAVQSSIGFHRDSVYISQQFVPSCNNSVTCWMPLTNVSTQNGTIEYVIGSHQWPNSGTPLADQTFHSSGDYRDSVKSFAKGLNITLQDQDFAPIQTNPGHGSAPNTSDTSDRYAIVSHLLRSDVSFRTHPPPGYIYGRYNLCGSDQVLDSFFPMLWPEPTRSLVVRAIPAVELQQLEDFR